MFMWEWQHVYQEAVKSLFEEIFKILELQPNFDIFVLGIPENGEDISHVFFQPEDWGILQKEFRGIFVAAKNNYENNNEKNIVLGAPHLDKAHKESLYPKALRNATQEVLDTYSDKKGAISFCSVPIKMNEHWIMTVIQLDRKFFDQYYRLQTKTIELNPIRKRQLDCSFLEAIIRETLSASQRELQSPSQGQYYGFANPERLLEDAAINLLNSISLRVSEMRGDLLTLANAISAERYEGEGSKGRLIIVEPLSPDVNVQINLIYSIEISNYRGIRKLLEVSSNAMALLCDGGYVWGLGNPRDSYNPSNENLFELNFTDHYTWELIHADNVMLRVKYRKPRLPRERFDKALFRDHISRLFNVSEDESDVLVKGVEGAVIQRHGTMLVFTPEAFNEAHRLSSQSTIIQPTRVTKEVISRLSSVDGAILIKPNGTIYAFGVILDGLASDNGTPDRGARFNSAIRYVDRQNNSGTPCLALIVSEDGYVDTYPKLRPRIPRKRIEELLDKVEIYAGSPENFDAEKARSNLLALDKLRFYLLNERDVERANSAKDTIVNREHEYWTKELSGTLMSHIPLFIADFSVHEEMNSEYYLPED